RHTRFSRDWSSDVCSSDLAAARFAWRLSILGIIGLVHHAFWRADILTIYVPLGFLLLFARNLSDRTLLIIGGLLVLNIPTKLARSEERRVGEGCRCVL